MSPIEIRQFTCRTDNFGVLVHDASSGSTISVDAPEERPIRAALEAEGWRLTHILTTHHHPDHVEANEALKAAFGVEIVGPVGDEWWRYLAAPFVYDDVGYLFACGLALAIFLPPIERRVGSIAAVLLVLGCGALGMLAAAGLDSSFGDEIPIAAGGNGVALGALCAYVVLRDAERRADPTEEYDRIAVAVAAVVLLALPLVEDFASVWAGLVGALVGGGCGLAAALGGRIQPGR